MAKTGKTTRPIGHDEHFLQAPSGRVPVKTRWEKRVNLTPARWNELVAVNNAVNGAVDR